MIYLDTHVLLWLYEGLMDKFPNKAIEQLEKNKLFISPMVELELQYLYEIKRVTCPAENILNELRIQLNLIYGEEPFKQIIRHAATLSWTRDPFDRIIVATAAVKNTPLLTKDSHLQQHYAAAFWT